MEPRRPPEPIGPLAPGVGLTAAVDEVERVLGRVPAGATVVVGASGGPDSAALLALTRRARPDLAVLAVHVRHGLRDDAEDVAAVTAQATALGVPLRVLAVAVDADGTGPEASARRARHDALQAAARDAADVPGREPAAAVLLGHSADDQAETVLLRLARGSGSRGLAGMAPWRPDDRGTPVGRPLLRLRRTDVRFVAAELGLPVATDPGNRDERFARTIVRDRVLPDLGRHAGDPVGAAARAADLLREDGDHLDALARVILEREVVPFGPCWSIRERAVLDAPPAIARRLWRGLAHRVGAELSAGDVDDLLRLDVGRLWETGSMRAGRGGGWLCVTRPAGTATGARATEVVDIRLGEVAMHLDVPDLDVPDLDVPDLAPVTLPGGRSGRTRLLLPAGVEPGVRTRRPGDLVATAAGHRSVQDLFVDAGVPRLVRDHVPLLTIDDRVVWVPGVEADAELAAAGHAAPQLEATLVSRSPAG